MSQALDLSDISVLNDLQAALTRFAEEGQTALKAAELEIQRTQEWVQDRINHWLREVDRVEREIVQINEDLRRCQASGYRDAQGHYLQPDCSAFFRALANAERILKDFEEKLETAKTWKTRIEDAVSVYERLARQLSELTEGHTRKAVGFLGYTAEKYRAVQIVADSVGSVGFTIASGLIGTAMVILDTAIGRANISKGDLIEDFAQYFTEDELGLKEVEFDRKKHGFDRILHGPDGHIIVLESKADSYGRLRLSSDNYGFKQGSAQWVAHVAGEMTRPGSELYSAGNAIIGQQILRTGASNVTMLATVINPNTGRAEIKLRMDDAADNWKPLGTGNVYGRGSE